MRTFTGKTVLITGASEGIGRALALTLAAEKPRLALAARWNGLPGRSELTALLLLATEGDEAGLSVLVPGARPQASDATANQMVPITNILRRP